MEDLNGIIDFLRQARKMMLTYRHTPKPDGKPEDDAEHSWSVALICMLLATRLEKESGVKIDQTKMLKMALIHDLAETITGDTVTWDAASRVNKEEKERKAMQDLAAKIPNDIGTELIELWEECEKRETLEAKIVKSIDRVDPVIHRVVFNVGWVNVTGDDGTVEALDKRQLPRHEFSKLITELYMKIRNEAVEKKMFDVKDGVA